ncbi:hypothetical protein [Streptomyces sp. NPDC046332]|uniref:hypothetical protein n=1 Tax=unclassified Streptomyces TaxID=2593676 RepID=UPI00340530A7
MALKTVVTMTVSDAALEEAHRAMQPLVNGRFGPVETSTSRADDGPKARTKLQLSLAGDVRDQVEEQLAAVPVLAYDVEVREGY